MAAAGLRSRQVVAARRWWGGGVTAAALCTVLAAAPVWADAEQPFFEYLYVEANDGGSSGGHAAICFTDDCYDFQQERGGTIRLRKEAAERLDHAYRALGNRTIRATRVGVSAETLALLRDTFAARYRKQSRELDVTAALAADTALIEHLLARQRGQADTPAIRLPGTAYFFADQRLSAAPHADRDAAAGEPPDAVIAELAARIRRTHGDDALERRAAALRTALEQLLPPLEESIVVLPTATAYPVPWVGFAERHRELVTGLLAVEVLRGALPLRDETILHSGDPDFALAPREVDSVRRRAAVLTQSLTTLFESKRSDWGYPMLVGMARLLALQASAAAGRLVVLDAYADNVAVLSAADVTRHAEALPPLLAERREDFVAARAAFFAGDPADEVSASYLETAGNLFVELDRALEERSAMRVHQGSLVPEKSALRRDWPVPELPPSLLERALAAAQKREREYQAALARLYPYDVVAHNCVTEIFRTVDAALGTSARSRVGGRVDVDGTMNFIPFVSARAVHDAYRATASIERRSYRRLILDDMYAREPTALVYLRESNVLTARAYSGNDADPVFVFFTDGLTLPRPLLGAANLGVGLGATIVGAFALPFDGGAVLRRGLNGVLFSLPELAFVNIRKGSYRFVPRRWRGSGLVVAR